MMKKIIVFGLIIIVILVVGLQFFLAYGLTDSLRQWVLPVIKERYNADVSVGSLSVNLLGGSLDVNDIKLANGPGFDEPTMLAIDRCRLKIGLPALFRGGSAEIQKAVINDLSLVIVRNKNGTLNLEPLLAAMSDSRSSRPAAGEVVPATSGQQEPQVKQRPLPNIVIKKMELYKKLTYIDWQIGQPFKLGLDIDLNLSNIANFGLEDSLSGVINLHGNILEDNKKCAFDLNGRISPITNPLLVSFDLSGSMQKADLKTFKGLIENIGLQDGNVSATATMVCRKGQFDPEKSVISLKFSDVVLTPEKAEKMKGIPLPSSFTVLVPVTGPFSNPQVNVGEAFVKTITSEAMVDSIIKGIIDAKKPSGDELKSGGKSSDSESKEPARKLDDIQNVLGDFFGGKKK